MLRRRKNWNEKSLFVRCEKCRQGTFQTIWCFVVCNKCLQTHHLQSCLSTRRPKHPQIALFLLMMFSRSLRRPENIFSSVNPRSTEVSDIMNQHELKGSLILFKDTEKRAILLLYYYFWYSQRHRRWERRRRRKHFLTANSSIKTKTFSRKIFSRFSDALQDGTKERKKSSRKTIRSI